MPTKTIRASLVSLALLMENLAVSTHGEGGRRCRPGSLGGANLIGLEVLR